MFFSIKAFPTLFGFSQSITQEEMQEHCEVERLQNQEPDEGVAFHSFLQSGFIANAINVWLLAFIASDVSDTTIKVIAANTLIISRSL